MKRIKSYNNFLIKNFEESVMISLYENLTNEEKKYIKKNDVISYMVNESIVNTLSEKGKNILKKIASTANNIFNFLNKIKEELSKHISEVLTNTKNKLKEKLKGNQVFISAVKKEINSDRNAFLHDVKTCSEVSNFYINKFKDSMLNDVMKSLHNLFRTRESLIFEDLDINIIDHLVKHLNKMPPFAWLDMLHHKGAEGAAHLINGLSYITKHLGGPEFTLPVISSLLGIAFEYNVKGLIKHGLIEAAEIFSVPFIGLVIKTAGNVATFLAAYELCREISSDIDDFNKAHHHEFSINK
jgi:hypothetical protein